MTFGNKRTNMILVTVPEEVGLTLYFNVWMECLSKTLEDACGKLGRNHFQFEARPMGCFLSGYGSSCYYEVHIPLRTP